VIRLSQISNSHTLSMTSLTVLTLCMVGLALGQDHGGGTCMDTLQDYDCEMCKKSCGHCGGHGGAGGAIGGGGGGARRRREAPQRERYKKIYEEMLSTCSGGEASVTWDQLRDCKHSVTKLKKVLEILRSTDNDLLIIFPLMLANPNKKIFDRDDKNKDGKVTFEEIVNARKMT